MKKYTEATLIVHLHQGDQLAFQHLYLNYRKNLLWAITQIVDDLLEAEDLLQDTFVKVLQRFHSFDARQGGLFNWLVNIARNTALDALRRRSVYQKISTRSDTVPVGTSFLLLTDTIGVETLVRQVLRPYQWQVIHLAYWQGCTHEEVAEQLAIPLGTVKTRIRQSLIRLRPHFDC